MLTPRNPDEEAAHLQACLTNLNEQLEVLDRFGISKAAVKVSEACHFLEKELVARQHDMPAR